MVTSSLVQEVGLSAKGEQKTAVKHGLCLGGISTGLLSQKWENKYCVRYAIDGRYISIDFSSPRCPSSFLVLLNHNWSTKNKGENILDKYMANI